MYKGLVDNLAFVYSFICKGRGKIPQEDLQAVAAGAHTIMKNAPAVLGGEEEKDEDRKDLALAGKMDYHIEDAVIFLQSLEIV